MKKFVIILLMCAVAVGTAFAQDGSWSVSGQGELGTMLNFAGPKTAKDYQQWAEDGRILSDNSKPYAMIGSSGYNNLGYYGYIGGQLGVKYNIGGLQAGLDFIGQRNSSYLSGVLNYRDDTRAFSYVQDIGGSKGILSNAFKPERLWGYYKLLDGVIHLEAAANSRDTVFWYINNGGEGGVLDRLYNDRNNIVLSPLGLHGELGFDDDPYMRGFTKVDHHNYLAVDVAPIDGLSFGVMIPSVFVFDQNKENYYGGHTQSGFSSNDGFPGYYNAQNNNEHVPFLDNALLKSRLGVKFASGPITVAGQFALLGRGQKNKIIVVQEFDNRGDDVNVNKVVPDYRIEEFNAGADVYFDPVRTINTGLYLEAKFAVSDSISAGVGFQGHFWSKTPTLGFGGTFDFNSGPFGAGLAIGLHTKINPTEHVYRAYKKGDPIAAAEQVGIEQKNLGAGRYEVEPDLDYDKNDYKIKKSTQSYLGLTPSVTYSIVENYLGFRLGGALYWRLGAQGDYDYSLGTPIFLGTYDRAYQTNNFAYEVTPELFFNVSGTGAGVGYYSASNLIIIRYKVAGWIDGKEVRTANKTWVNEDVRNGDHLNKRPLYNAVDITFKWSF